MIGPHKTILASGIFRGPIEAAGHADHRPVMIEMLRRATHLHPLIDGVELGFRKPEDILGFTLDEAGCDFLRSLPENTSHFPYEHRIKDDALTRQLFSALKRIYADLGIKSTVVHPHIVDDKQFFFGAWREMGLGPICIENWIRTKEIGIPAFEDLFSDEQTGMTFDTCHATTASLAALGFTFRYLLPRFERRIRYIHLSGTRLVPVFEDPLEPGIKQFCKGHYFIHQLSRTELALLEPVWILLARNPDIRIVLEQTARDGDRFPEVLVAEIRCVGKLIAEASHSGL